MNNIYIDLEDTARKYLMDLLDRAFDAGAMDITMDHYATFIRVIETAKLDVLMELIQEVEESLGE